MPFAAILLAGLLAVLAATPAPADDPAPGPVPELSLDELLDLRVTSVARKEQRLADSASAIHVITREDIARSGANSIPELLRLVPGANVGQINASTWAVSMRGFNGHWANKLLVLQDGRELYTPLYAGVYWEAQNLVLDDIERIEVIRGPAASLWGPNALNGGINIITKHAGDTLGNLLSAGAGDRRAAAAVRHGRPLGEAGHLRLYASASEEGANVMADGSRAADDWRGQRAGFRLDRESGRSAFRLLGDAYRVQAGELFALPSLTEPSGATPLRADKEFRGAFLLGEWRQRSGDRDELVVQGYFDHARNDFPSVLLEQRNTLDVQFRQRLGLGERHDFIWGLAYRRSADQTRPGVTNAFDPADRSLAFYSLFVHDEVSLVPERWKLIVGARLDHNDYSGAEVQPNLRLLWTPSPAQSLWLALSGAVRTPSRAETDMRLDFAALPGTPSTLFRYLGNPGLEAEHLTALDMGYRGQLGRGLSLDLAAFAYRYRDVARPVAGTPVFEAVPTPPHLLLPFRWSNVAGGHSWGGEVSLDWRAVDHTRLSLAYGFLDTDFYLGEQPQHGLSLRLGLDPSPTTQVDLWLRHQSAFELAFARDARIPAHTGLDLRLAWRPRSDLELAVVGKNLLDDHHAEYRSTYAVNDEFQIRRSVQVNLAWHF